ncbi:MAG: hypothetical protein ACH36H_12150 [Candidatus Nanopelagicales bacterium]
MTWAAAWAALKGAWKLLNSRPGWALAGAVVAVLVLGELAGRSAPTPEAYVPRPTKRIAEAPKVTETLSVELAQPADKTRKRIAADYNRPDLLAPRSPSAPVFTGREPAFAAEITGEWIVAPAPWGGTALGTIDPGTGTAGLDFKPNPEPRFSLRNRWEIAAAYGKTEDALSLIRAEVRWRPVKIRRLELGAVAGWERTDRGRAYLLGEVAWGVR